MTFMITSPHCMTGQARHWQFESREAAAAWIEDDTNFPHGLRAGPDDRRLRRAVAELIRARADQMMCYGLVWSTKTGD